jgi:hypothetical protein
MADEVKKAKLELVTEEELDESNIHKAIGEAKMKKSNIAKLARDIRDCGPELEGIDAMIEEKYPHATRAEIGRAIEIVQHDVRQEGAEWEREKNALERLMAVVGELKPGQTVGEKLQAMAAEGDERAGQILASWNTREARVNNALIDAAAEKHPDWTRTRNGWKYVGEGEPPRNMRGVVDWFQKEHPHEARRIEDETE